MANKEQRSCGDTIIQKYDLIDVRMATGPRQTGRRA
jgi:hypothetical protein